MSGLSPTILMRRLEKYFRIQESGSTISRELLGGTTTFLALSYIIFVQPGLLSQAGMDFHAVLYATCLASALATFLMGLVANYPVALAPALIIVGSMMRRVISQIAWDDPTEAIPAFLTFFGIPFSFSIASGIAFGFIGYRFAKLVSGRARECPALV